LWKKSKKRKIIIGNEVVKQMNLFNSLGWDTTLVS
jgi:hypothetical protein